MSKSIPQVVEQGLCISCGACASLDGITVAMRENKSGIYEPLFKDGQYDKEAFNTICPGVGYDIEGIAKASLDEAHHYSEELGYYSKISAIRSQDSTITKNASSGGAMTAVALHLLNEGIVSGVVVTKNIGSRNLTYIATDKLALIESQGSKYCPVPALDIKELVEGFDGVLAFIGTPCQIAAIHGMQASKEQCSAWSHKIIFTMANFCGGFRDLRETDLLIERAGFDPKNIDSLSYRGNGQPGEMKITKGTKCKALKYPDYVRGTGIAKHKRCRFCVDATGELADISFGDAWIPRFLESGKAWSLAVARSSKGNKIINDMSIKEKLHELSVSEEEVIKSQIGNISTKKYRQAARMMVANLFRIQTPEFNDSRFKKVTSISFELKVIVTTYAFSLLEKIGLYQLVAKLLNRYPEDLK